MNGPVAERETARFEVLPFERAEQEAAQLPEPVRLDGDQLPQARR